jgi:hypothetical protein
MLLNLKSSTAIAGNEPAKPDCTNHKNNPAKNYVPDPGHIIH